jgi:hypothetical protein
MDFTVTVGAPTAVSIRINGTDYKAPRFLLPAFKEYASDLARKQMDEAVAEYSDEGERARFRVFYSVVPKDVAQIAQWLRAPDGIEHVLRTCLAKGGVPPELIEALLTNADPSRLLAQSYELASAAEAEKELRKESGEEAGANPLTPPPAT